MPRQPYDIILQTIPTASNDQHALVYDDAIGFFKFFTDRGMDEVHDLLKFYNGIILETFDALVTSNGSVITLTVTATAGGDLTMNFSDGVTVLDVDPTPATIALTAGSDSAPQLNYIFIPQDTKVLTKSTSAFPTEEHIRIGLFLVQSATFVQNNGALGNRNWNDHITNGNNLGHLSHITEYIRASPPIYKTGVAPTITITVNGGSPDNVDLDVTAGVVYQLHRQATPALDTATGAVICVVNDPTTPYRQITDINEIDEDSAGVSLDNRYYNLVFWMIVNEEGEFVPLMMNLPGGSYALLSGAVGDTAGFDDFSIPTDIDIEMSTGFLVSRFTFKHSAAASGTITLEDTVDLRGTTPTQVTGGGGLPQTVFSDSNFSLFNVSVVTKTMDFDLSGLITATNVTLTVPDVSGMIALSAEGGGVIVLGDSTSPTIPGSFGDVPFDTERKKTANFTHSNITNNEEVTCVVAGIVKSDVNVSFDFTSGTGNIVFIKMQIDTGGGFVDVNDSLREGQVAVNGSEQLSINLPIEVSAGDVLKVLWDENGAVCSGPAGERSWSMHYLTTVT